jgi:hypothetical protein
VGRESAAVMQDVSWHCGTVLLKNVQFNVGSKRKGSYRKWRIVHFGKELPSWTKLPRTQPLMANT